MLAKRIYTALILICVFFVAVTQLSADISGHARFFCDHVCRCLRYQRMGLWA